MSKKIVLFLLLLAILIGAFFSLYKRNQAPPCFNSDEAAFGYNAYSLLKTGRDEYGAFLPLRLKSFLDYKMPLYSYFSVPFIALFGLSESSTRALNLFIGLALIPLSYLVVNELFKKKEVAIIASFLVAINPGIFILTRQAHEGVLGAFFLLLAIYSLARFFKTDQLRYFIITNIAILLNTYSYQNGRIFFAFFVLTQLFYFYKKRKQMSQKLMLYIFIILAVTFVSFFPDVKYGVNRVENLIFYKTPGFQLRINEYLREDNNRLLHNKLTEAVESIVNNYSNQFSTQFLTVNGDTNLRFGFPELGLITQVEYLVFFIGLYYLFRNRQEYRYFLLLLLFISPLSSALTWQDPSLNRAYIMLFPILYIIAYGAYFSFINANRNQKVVFGLGFLLFLFLWISNWDIYLNHYSKRAVVVRTWECGYKEVTDYVKTNYNRFDNFYVTDRNGEPYIFFLFYLKYDPAKYQKVARISGPDDFGYGQVGGFDKFHFKFDYNPAWKHVAYIGFPDEIKAITSDDSKIKKIKIGTENMFWIYEVN